MEKSVKRRENRSVLGVRNRILTASRSEDGEGVPGAKSEGAERTKSKGIGTYLAHVARETR